MRKYYIALAILCAAGLALFGYVLLQGISTKQDAKTLTSAQDIASKLNSYIDQHQSIPASLEQAGVKNRPDTITYEKIDTTKYKFCVSYKGSSAPDYTGSLWGIAGQYPTDPGYYGGGDNTQLYISPQYKKGKNCQTITPYLYGAVNYNTPSVLQGGGGSLSPANEGLATICSEGAQTYPISIYGTIKSINTTTSTIDVTSAPSDITVGNGGNASLAATNQITYNSNTTFYDVDCNKTSASGLKIGDGAYFYTNSKTGSSAVAASVELSSTN